MGGGDHANPERFWGKSTRLCLQLLQQAEMQDTFLASEFEPLIHQIEDPTAQQDASEILSKV